MAYTVRKVKVLSARTKDEVGALAKLLQPLAKAGVSLDSLVGYVEKPGKPCNIYATLATTGKKATTAAATAGFAPDPKSAALIVEGTDKAGAGHEIGQALADAGVSARVCVALATGRKLVVLLGFDSDADATKAAQKLRATGVKKSPKKKATKKKVTSALAQPAKKTTKKKTTKKKAAPKKAAATKKTAKKATARKAAVKKAVKKTAKKAAPKKAAAKTKATKKKAAPKKAVAKKTTKKKAKKTAKKRK